PQFTSGWPGQESRPSHSPRYARTSARIASTNATASAAPRSSSSEQRDELRPRPAHSSKHTTLEGGSMTTTHCDISMSLDGIITRPNEGVGNPLGDDDGRLHDWMFGKATDADANVLGQAYARTGAIVMGKRMFDVGVQPWGDPPPFRDLPVFVLTHEARDP